jgi:hypothetical protein
MPRKSPRRQAMIGFVPIYTTFREVFDVENVALAEKPIHFQKLVLVLRQLSNWVLEDNAPLRQRRKMI